MKISDVKTYVVGNPPPHHGGRYFVFLKLTTDGGVEGFGEAYSVPFHPHTVARMIEDVCERCVIGADPFKAIPNALTPQSWAYSAPLRWPAGTLLAKS
jgi:galactonate dehydratase